MCSRLIQYCRKPEVHLFDTHPLLNYNNMLKPNLYTVGHGINLIVFYKFSFYPTMLCILVYLNNFLPFPPILITIECIFLFNSC